MRDWLDGELLLSLARASLRDDLLARLPADARYRARLVANAMAIAGRAMAAGEGPRREALQALAALYGESVPDGSPGVEGRDEALTRLNWRLAAEIRAGQRDGDAQVHGHLLASAGARLKLVNPTALSPGDESAAQ